jgi:hypothetical protein
MPLQRAFLYWNPCTTRANAIRQNAPLDVIRENEQTLWQNTKKRQVEENHLLDTARAFWML